MGTATTFPGIRQSQQATTLIRPGRAAAPVQPYPIDTSGNSYVITAAASGAGVDAGDQFDDFSVLTKLLAAKFDTLSRSTTDPTSMVLASARPEDLANAYSTISRSMIASLKFSRKHDFVLAHQHDWQTIERACSESRLPGGSLTAAPGTPGWCAPCTVSYDFCPPAVLDGIVDLPTVVAPRGCITFPVMPDFGQLYAGTGFCFPAADYDLTTNPNPVPPPPGEQNPFWAKNKPCMPVPCPETQTCTLDPCGVCLQSSILVERAYPELITNFMANALVAWGHRMNCRDLAQMIAKSTRVPTVGSVDGNSIGAPTGPGATASILEVIDFYATWLRYKYRLGAAASVEVVLPVWGRGVIRADLSKRMGVDLLSVTDAMIDAYLLIRKVRVQWVLGLDEAFCDTGTTSPPVQIDPATSQKFGGNYVLGAAAGPGGTPAQVPPSLWPDTISLLMYPAGTFFRARMNLVNIEGGLVDSALLKRNERLLLFLEEASVVCKRCYDSLFITIDICASGQTGGGSTTNPDCVIPPPPPPPPAPAITVAEAAGDADHMTVSVKVDNHGRGPVTIKWGQATPALPDSTNAGDNVAVTNQKYTEDGTHTITVVDNSATTNTATAQVTLPYAGAPALDLTVVDNDPTDAANRRTAKATWDNHGQGPVKVLWNDPGNEPTGGEVQPVSGTLTHTYLDTVTGPTNVVVTDTTTPSRTKTVSITLPFPDPAG